MHQPASPTVDIAAEAKRGERDGRRWAMFSATAPQLSALAAMARVHASAEDTSGNPGNFLDVWLALTIGDIYGQEFVDVRSYRSIFPRAALHSTAYLGAFVRAAAAVWRECQVEIAVE